MPDKSFDTNNRPNLLIIITDQERAVMHFPEGWAAKHLPSMEVLKRHGVEFKNGFCNACMCSPSRSTLFSGMYPAQHGVTDTLSFGGKYSITEPALNPGMSNLAHMLRPHYDVQYRGKWHMSKGGMNTVHPEKSLMAAEVAQFGFRGWIPPDAGEDIALPNFGGGYAEHDARYIKEAIEYIRQWKTEKEAGIPVKPFALILSLVNPHDVLSYPKTWEAGGYDESWLNGTIEPPVSAEENLLENWKPAAQWMLKAVSAVSLGELKSFEQKRNYINFYGNLMQFIDGQIGILLGEFYERDERGRFGKPKQLARETVIVRLADHGEMGMAHGGLRQKAFNAYDETLRVPYIFSNPDVINNTGTAKTTHQLAGLIDIIPTLGGLLQLQPASTIKGTDLSEAVLNPDLPEDLQGSHLFTFDDVRAGNKNVPQAVNAANRVRCVRTRDWKFNRYFHANGSYLEEFELYYIRGIEDSETHDPADANDPLGTALRGLPYEFANLYYDENPLFKNLPEPAKEIVWQARKDMAELLRRRELDILTGTDLQARKQAEAVLEQTGATSN